MSSVQCPVLILHVFSYQVWITSSRFNGSFHRTEPANKPSWDKYPSLHACSTYTILLHSWLLYLCFNIQLCTCVLIFNFVISRNKGSSNTIINHNIEVPVGTMNQSPHPQTTLLPGNPPPPIMSYPANSEKDHFNFQSPPFFLTMLLFNNITKECPSFILPNTEIY